MGCLQFCRLWQERTLQPRPRPGAWKVELDRLLLASAKMHRMAAKAVAERSSHAQRVDDLHAGGPYGRQETAEEAHHEREDERPQHDPGRQHKPKCELGERRPVERRDLHLRHERCERKPNDPADEREQQRLNKESNEDPRAPKSERAQDPYLHHAAGHGRVHRYRRANDGAEREQHRERDPENLNEPGEQARLLLVEDALALSLDGKAGIRFEARLERIKAGAISEPHRDRREKVSPKRLHKLLAIAPDLGIEPAAARVEPAYDLPLPLSKPEARSNLDVFEPPRERSADYDLVRSRTKHAPLGEPHLRTHSQSGWTNAADQNVARLLGLASWPRDQHSHFLRYKRRAFGSDHNFGLAFDDPGLPTVDQALDFDFRRAAYEDDVRVFAGCNECLLESGVKHE